MEFAFSSCRQNPAETRSFAFQYVSLILIILTFVIGAFAREKLAVSQTTKEDNPVTDLEQAGSYDWLHGKLLIKDLFRPEASAFSINIPAAAALAAVLKSHDLGAEIDVSMTGDYAAAVRQSAALYRYFIDQGVPPMTVRVSALMQPPADRVLSALAAPDAVVRWYRISRAQSPSAELGACCGEINQ